MSEEAPVNTGAVGWPVGSSDQTSPVPSVSGMTITPSYQVVQVLEAAAQRAFRW